MRLRYCAGMARGKKQSASRAAKQPTKIEPLFSGSERIECLLHLQAQLARQGRDFKGLKQYQQTIIHELSDSQARSFAGMHDWWRYDLDRLIERGKGYGEPAKPRIDLTIDITSQDNLTLEWLTDW